MSNDHINQWLIMMRGRSKMLARLGEHRMRAHLQNIARVKARQKRREKAA